MQKLNEEIRERAYHLWIADGRQDGKADAYWLSAQREILTSSIASGTACSRTARTETKVVEAKYAAKKSKAAVADRKNKRHAA